MSFVRKRIILLFTILIILPTVLWSQTENEDPKSLEMGLRILKRYFYEQNKWYITKPTVANNVKGLVDFIENEPIDSVIGNLNKSVAEKQTYVFRLPENVDDSLSVPGFIAYSRVSERIDEITSQLKKEYSGKRNEIPANITPEIEARLNLVPKGKGMSLFANGIFQLPAEYLIPEVVPDSVLNSAEATRQYILTDSLRQVYIEQKRIDYNDSIVAAYFKTLNEQYSQEALQKETDYQIKRITDSVKVNNYNVLREYNELVVKSVNDSIATVLETLTQYANFIDSTSVSMTNISGEISNIPLKSGSEHFTRFWLKNIQNDSLSVLVKSWDKRSISMMLDDGVTITRYKPKENKEFDFKTLEKNISALNKVGKAYEVETPWVLGGDGHIGFSQTYLSNWEKGGQSAIASLIALKGFANYKRADGQIKWDNSGEIRNGWVYQGGEEKEVQKNDDKFEITSRFGVSIHQDKKWFYSAEFNFNTQLFNGYKYPKEKYPDPVSGFLAPSRTFFKLGLEYKPTKEFSLMVSPLTVKNVYVRDTVKYDQTRFGIEPNRKSFWEPGLNTDIYYKRAFTENIVYDTKFKMFINYKHIFNKQDINWENNINFKLNEFITFRFLLHLIYDDNVKFAVYDENGNKTGEKAKLQVKEYFSIGLSYKINYKVMHSKRVR